MLVTGARGDRCRFDSVVKIDSGPFAGAGGGTGKCRKGVGVEMFAHVARRHVPDGEQHALALVVARAALVGLAEVAKSDGPVHGRDDLGQPDLVRISGEHITAAHASLGANESGTLQCQKDLLQIGLGKSGAFGNVAHRGRPRGFGVQRERQQGAARIVTAGRHSHETNLGAGL